MNTVIPGWECLHDWNPALLPPPSTHCPSSSPPSDASMLGYGVSELTWKNGQLAMSGFDTAKRVSDGKPLSTTTTTTAATSVTDVSHNWAKPSCNGTLESVVDQAHGRNIADERPPWFMLAQYAAIPPPPVVAAVAPAAAATTMRVDAAVPCSGSTQDPSSHVLGGTGGGAGPCVVACSTRVESCSAGTMDNWNGRNEQAMKKRAKLAADYSSRENSVSGTMDTQPITLETCDWEGDVPGATSLGSPGNTSSANKTTADDRDSVGHSRPQRGGGDEKDKKKVLGAKASVTTKRSRAAAVHNQSERKRRDKINERMRTLQKLVPHSSKSDKASMLDEVIEYLKQLQVQINMMSRMGMSPMNMNPMMMPMALQQQMQMSMMSQMGMGMGMNPMGMGMMDMNAMGRSNVPGLSPSVLHPNPYMPMQPPQWDMTGGVPTNAANANDRVLPPPAGPSLVHAPPGPPLLPDPIATSLLAFQSQPLTLEGYSKMAAMFQQMNQIPTSGAKN